MFEFFLVPFGESAFSALDFSNCQMRKKKKINFIIYFYFWGRGGWGGGGKVSMSAVAANMKNLCVDLEHVDMYIFFINHCVYLIY